MRKTEKITALYERLSRDDDQQGESNSISNQNHTWKKRQDGMDTPVYDISPMTG